MLEGLLGGIWNALTPMNLLAGLIGCTLGTIVGILPGLGPTSSIAILLPVTLRFPAAPAMIMMAGIYYGAMYGGSTTAILMNIPGEPSAVPTTYDGYEMAKQGRAGPALAICAIGSFVGGTLSIIALTITGPLIANIMFYFSPADYAGLFMFSLLTMAILSSRSILKGTLMMLIGVLLSTVGCSLSGIPCFTYGFTPLLRGLDLISMVIGLFGIGEIFINLEEEVITIAKAKLGKLMPTFKELRNCVGCMLRSTGLGFFLGLLPGVAPTIASFMAYDIEKRVSKAKANFGKGALEGVCAPETANNATAQAGFIPLMAFGIPPTPALAILLTGFVMYGLSPGPMLFVKHADFVWTLIGAMYIGNIMLLILNLPLVGLWVRITYIPYKILAPIILGLCFIGAYVNRNTMWDVLVALIFGIFGYAAKKLDWPIPPVILGFILGPMFVTALGGALTISGGSIFIFSSPISLSFLLLTLLLVCIKLYFRKH
jgi:putative tricarboxylic transport membrane protein